jgi:hypothetical protein
MVFSLINVPRLARKNLIPLTICALSKIRSTLRELRHYTCISFQLTR